MPQSDRLESDDAVRELIARTRSGDEAAREELFERCRRYVGLVARVQLESWLQQKVDASDLVQQTLMEAHRGFERFRGETQAEWLGWLRQIVTHNATDCVRHWQKAARRNVNREVPLGGLPGGISGSFRADVADRDGATPSEVAMQHEQELELADALDQLPEDYQEIIVLRNLQRLPFDEISARMGRSRGACQMLWTRAIQQLQKLMAGTDG